MSRRHFGTDGVRGIANRQLTPDLALQLGRGTGRYIDEAGLTPRVAIGRDTRKSGSMLGAAFAAGLNSAGIEVTVLAVAPTPAISFVTRHGDYGLGGIISASHNPAPDNGIKLVGHDGRKLADEVELRIEDLMEAEIAAPTGGAVGAITSDATEIGAYMDYLESIVPERLEGMRVAVDAANGAAYQLGPEILRRLGADVITTGTDPGDGTRINAEGGATKPQTIQDFTVATGAEIGVAFDGDADRVVFSDSAGRLINGDRTMGMWAVHRLAQGQLDPAVVVGTVMSNGGFAEYLAAKGIELERAPVGDKYVAQRIVARGAHIGGEQSGHIIFPAHGPTGDGLATMLETLRTLKLSGRSAASLYDEFANWPQLLVNIHVDRKTGWEDALAPVIASSEARLADRGRILVRASGTQPMIRVMVEADEAQVRDEVADSLVDALIGAMGGRVEGRVDLTYALGD